MRRNTGAPLKRNKRVDPSFGSFHHVFSLLFPLSAPALKGGCREFASTDMLPSSRLASRSLARKPDPFEFLDKLSDIEQQRT